MEARPLSVQTSASSAACMACGSQQGDSSMSSARKAIFNDTNGDDNWVDRLTCVAFAAKEIHSSVAAGERVSVAGFWSQALWLELQPCAPAACVSFKWCERHGCLCASDLVYSGTKMGTSAGLCIHGTAAECWHKEEEAHVDTSKSHVSSTRFSVASRPPNSRTLPPGRPTMPAKSLGDGRGASLGMSTILHSHVSCRHPLTFGHSVRYTLHAILH